MKAGEPWLTWHAPTAAPNKLPSQQAPSEESAAASRQLQQAVLNGALLVLLVRSAQHDA